MSWRVHIPTAGETCLRVRCGQDAATGGWPLPRALVELGRLGLRPTERFRSLGAGRGRPLLHSQEAGWRGLPVHLESVVSERGTVVEAALALPGMDEVVAEVDEAAWWELADTFCAAVDAVHGALVDGEPLRMEPAVRDEEWPRRLRDHVGLLVPEALTGVTWEPSGDVYTSLPMSRLAVVLR